jgi:hypothetical protein
LAASFSTIEADLEWNANENCPHRAPLAESVPPRLYGGTERVVSWLVEELVELGHDVTLFASGDSVSLGAKLVPVLPRALRLGRPRSDPIAAQAALLETVAEHASD